MSMELVEILLERIFLLQKNLTCNRHCHLPMELN